MEEEIERYKERSTTLESECRKLRSNSSKMASDLEELENKYEEKKQEA